MAKTETGPQVAIYVDNARHSLPTLQKVVFDIEADIRFINLGDEEKTKQANALIKVRKVSKTVLEVEDYQSIRDGLLNRRAVQEAVNAALMQQGEINLVPKFLQRVEKIEDFSRSEIEKWQKVFDVIGKHQMRYLRKKETKQKMRREKRKERDERKQDKEMEKLYNPATGEPMEE